MVNSSHAREMPSGLRSRAGQIAIWGVGRAPVERRKGTKDGTRGGRREESETLGLRVQGKARRLKVPGRKRRAGLGLPE